MEKSKDKQKYAGILIAVTLLVIGFLFGTVTKCPQVAVAVIALSPTVKQSASEKSISSAIPLILLSISWINNRK